MKKRIKLETTSEFPKNFIGISSHFKDIQVVWSFNNLLGLKFTKTEDFLKKIKKSETTFHFSSFLYTDNQNFKHYLIANKNNETILFPKYKTIDFIYISDISDKQLKTVIQTISVSDKIIGNFLLPTENLIKIFKSLFEE